MGFLDFLFGGEEETPNPMRQWGEQGPQATWNYYESAIADSQRVMQDYWNTWTAQMNAVKNMYSGSMASIEQNYNAAFQNIDMQRKDFYVLIFFFLRSLATFHNAYKRETMERLI